MNCPEAGADPNLARARNHSIEAAIQVCAHCTYLISMRTSNCNTKHSDGGQQTDFQGMSEVLANPILIEPEPAHSMVEGSVVTL